MAMQAGSLSPSSITMSSASSPNLNIADEYRMVFRRASYV